MKPCKTCIYFTEREFEVACYRYPVPTPTLTDSWCGEHKEIPKKPVKKTTPKKSVKKEVKKQ